MTTVNTGPGDLAADARFMEALERAGATSPASAMPLTASTPPDAFRLARLIRIGRIHEAPRNGYFYDLESDGKIVA